MASLSTAASRVCLRSTALARPAVRALSCTASRNDSDAASYSSPFQKVSGASKGNRIPDFGKYISDNSEGRNKLFGYFMVGTMGALTAAGAKSTVQGALGSPNCAMHDLFPSLGFFLVA